MTCQIFAKQPLSYYWENDRAFSLEIICNAFYFSTRVGIDAFLKKRNIILRNLCDLFSLQHSKTSQIKLNENPSLGPLNHRKKHSSAKKHGKICFRKPCLFLIFCFAVLTSLTLTSNQVHPKKIVGKFSLLF
jgi:hypothetical protein